MTEKDLIEKLPGDLRAIAEDIGLEATLKLARRFRSCWVYVHSLDDIEREIRDDKIRTQYDAGQKIRDIALQHGLGERQIWNILGKLPEDPAPLPLFAKLFKDL